MHKFYFVCFLGIKCVMTTESYLIHWYWNVLHVELDLILENEYLWKKIPLPFEPEQPVFVSQTVLVI